MLQNWQELKELALSLNLPCVTVDYPWGNEALKAHSKMWCWWSPYADAAVFRAEFDERDMLISADPNAFFLHPHYAKHPYVLVRAGHLDPTWVQARLIREWRRAAPKRWLKNWDALQSGQGDDREP